MRIVGVASAAAASWSLQVDKCDSCGQSRMASYALDRSMKEADAAMAAQLQEEEFSAAGDSSSEQGGGKGGSSSEQGDGKGKQRKLPRFERLRLTGGLLPLSATLSVFCLYLVVLQME